MERYKLLPPLPAEPRGPSLEPRKARKHKPSASEPAASIRLDPRDCRKRTPVPPPKAHVKSNSDSSLGPGLSGNKRAGNWGSFRSNVSSTTTLVNGGVMPDQQQQQQQQKRTRSQSRSIKARDTVPEPEIDRAVGRKSVPASTMEAPIEEVDSGVKCSTSTELQGLWKAANGQRPENGLKKFSLGFSRTGPLTFSLGEDPHQPFYTMHTQTQGKKLWMTRTNPCQPQRTTSIMALDLETRRRHGPSDGLVTVLFSRVAALLAMEQAGEYATQQGLDSRAALEVEGNALRRAAEQESYHLKWNNDGRLYELQHAQSPPQPQALIGAMGIPLSPIQQQHLTSTLHITISMSTTNQQQQQHQPPTIIVTNPMPSNSTGTETARQAATARTSTLPHPAADDPLASLDLATMVFTVDADAIMAVAPSLYAVDSVVAAVLAVAVVDRQTRGVLDGLGLYDREDPLAPSAVFRSRSVSEGTAADTVRDNDSVREDADTGTGAGNNKWTRLHPRRTFFTRHSKKTTPKQRRKILIDEFSPMHHGHYGPGSSREGQALPRPTVRVIHGLYWTLEVVVRGMTVVVRGVGRLVVEVTRGVTFLGGKLERKT